MSALLVGYARCSTDQQVLTAQREALVDLGVEVHRIYVDDGLTGTNPDGPGSNRATVLFPPPGGPVTTRRSDTESSMSASGLRARRTMARFRMQILESHPGLVQ